MEGVMTERSLEEQRERLFQVMGEFMEAVNRFCKELNDTRWFLGEEKARNTKLEERISWLEQRIRELETECARLRKERDEANWYLGEERARRAELEKRLR
ncbi:MAG: hypothetical protein NC821_05680 [Candidatus Omnitrophica bacterium]|nr:hypothetical protein [Candidatus Omnitrophota bacterium]